MNSVADRLIGVRERQLWWGGGWGRGGGGTTQIIQLAGALLVFSRAYSTPAEYSYGTRLGASSEQVRDVNPDFGFRVFDKPTSES